MSNTPHTLGDEFPDQRETIHVLKQKSVHFAQLLGEYDTVNDQIHRAETRIDAVSDEAEAALRKRRLALKDEIAQALAAA